MTILSIEYLFRRPKPYPHGYRLTYQYPPNRLDETDFFIKNPSISLVKQALLKNQLLSPPLRPSFTLVKSVFSAFSPLGHPLWFPLPSLGPPWDLHWCSCGPLVLLIVSQWSPCRLHWRPCGALGSSIGVSWCPRGLHWCPCGALLTSLAAPSVPLQAPSVSLWSPCDILRCPCEPIGVSLVSLWPPFGVHVVPMQPSLMSLWYSCGLISVPLVSLWLPLEFISSAELRWCPLDGLASSVCVPLVPLWPPSDIHSGYQYPLWRYPISCILYPIS